ncbi:MAG: FKBP-type peptidyl-prolyl cis-trans isomerase [Bacteroidaceae bacterium]|nr:FKBP-type peptidyl-prolyl cis-trans isomerase [Bacteroidaceae bacterium]
MKKFSVVLAVAAAACGFVSCTAQSPKANLKTELDTLAYSIGMSNTQGLKDYMVQRLDVDTAYIDEFLKGVIEGANSADNKKQNAYYAGIQIGQQVGGQMFPSLNQQIFGADSTQTISKDNFLAGFVAGVLEDSKIMNLEVANNIAQEKMTKIQEKMMEEKYGANRKAGEDFLAQNAKKEGIQVLDGGVQYEVLTEGKGAIPTETSRVKVHYKGTLLDGTVFDSSYDRNEPSTFRADQVIKGWTIALTHMPVGSKWKVYIPQDQAYGSREAGQIQPYSMLTFEIELISIEE